MVLCHWLYLIETIYNHNFAENVSPKSAEVTQWFAARFTWGPTGLIMTLGRMSGMVNTKFPHNQWLKKEK